MMGGGGKDGRRKKREKKDRIVRYLIMRGISGLSSPMTDLRWVS
jgi:hypothetical protein